MDNYNDVVAQMEAFGVEFVPRDFPLAIPTPKRKTCGKKGKYWYWLQLWRPRDRDGVETGREYVVGKFGTYKHGGSDAKVDIDHTPASIQERERMQRERKAAAERAVQLKRELAELAALTAFDLWRRASREGRSPYLERKGVAAESCRYLRDGSIVIPLLRYDRPKEEALRAVQRIYPGPRWDERSGDELPQKTFTKDFAKTGCSLRLGNVDDDTPLVLVCEGYATGLSIRMATDRQVPVYIALDAYNLEPVVEIVRAIHPTVRILICADDDWRTADHRGANPGRRAAMAAAKATPSCDIVWPVFAASTRQAGDTDFNDLHLREGLPVVSKQLHAVMRALQLYGARHVR
jgi:putative DNA primase/helicase